MVDPISRAYRDIGSRVNLSAAGVHKVIRRQLRLSAELRDELDTKGAVESYLARMEALLSSSWPKALRGDLRAADQCRRALDSMARVQGIVPSLSERLLPDRLDDGDSDDDEEEDGLDELERWRRDRALKYEA